MIEWTAPGPGPWQQDQAHTPVSATRAAQATYPVGFNRGFTETFGRYGLLLDRLAMGVVNGFTYHQPRPFDMPGPDGPLTDEQIGAEIGRRSALAAETFETKRWRGDLEDWDRSWKPKAVERHRALGDVDLSSLDSATFVDHLQDVENHVVEMVYQHHRFNMAALLPVGDFALQVAGWLHREPSSLLAVLDGYSPVSSLLSPELEPVVAALRADHDLMTLALGDGDPSERLAQLRHRCAEVDDFVRAVGCRLVEGFDVTAPTLLERPDLLVGRIAAALEADTEGPRLRAATFAGELRAAVADELRPEFDSLLDEARAVYRLRDERGIYSDVSAIGLLRLALLEAGRRLMTSGRLDDPELALDATVDEVVGLLDGADEPSGSELVERQQIRRALTEAGAPRFLGSPPPPPPPMDLLPPPLARMMAAVGFCIEGILGQLEAPAGDETCIEGIPASAGSYEGTARIVRGIDELDRIESGDILVAPTTGEAFNSMLHLVKGIVTDHGSFACHAGIVSREIGIPAVVGTVDGTKRIPDGSTIRVDGTTGQVTVLM